MFYVVETMVSPIQMTDDSDARKHFDSDGTSYIGLSEPFRDTTCLVPRRFNMGHFRLYNTNT